MFRILRAIVHRLRRARTVTKQRIRWFRDEVEVAGGSFVAPATVIGRRTRVNAASHLDPCEIGPYCAIAGRLVVRRGNHYLQFLNIQQTAQARVIQGAPVLKPPSDIVRIGAACWIGDSVIILEGVQIGNGAVIGAGSVVTKSIPDYAIAVGNPARVVRRRFSDEVIELLADLDWWTWSDEKLRANKDLFELDLTTVDPQDLKERLGQIARTESD
jgi:virginiamycin A acetyltransferase